MPSSNHVGQSHPATPILLNCASISIPAAATQQAPESLDTGNLSYPVLRLFGTFVARDGLNPGMGSITGGAGHVNHRGNRRKREKTALPITFRPSRDRAASRDRARDGDP